MLYTSPHPEIHPIHPLIGPRCYIRLRRIIVKGGNFMPGGNTTHYSRQPPRIRNTSLASPSLLQKIWMAISRQGRDLPEIRWCQTDKNFKGFSDFIKNGFLHFWGFWLYRGNEKSYRWYQNYPILKGVSDFIKNDFCITGDFWLYLGNEKSYRWYQN